MRGHPKEKVGIHRYTTFHTRDMKFLRARAEKAKTHCASLHRKAKHKSTAAQPHAQKRLQTSWLMNDQCELIRIHLYCFTFWGIFVPFVNCFCLNIAACMCTFSFTPEVLHFSVTSAHCTFLLFWYLCVHNVICLWYLKDAFLCKDNLNKSLGWYMC